MAEQNVIIITELAALLSLSSEVAEGVARILHGLSLKGPEKRAAALALVAVPAMLPYLRPETPPELLRVLTKTFRNLCRRDDDEAAVPLELVLPALPLLKDLLHTGDQHVLEAACEAVTYITHGTIEHIAAVQAIPGLIARLVALLGHEAASVGKAARGAVANVLAGTDTQVEHWLDANCLEPIASLLRSGDLSIAELAARAIGNIFMHTHLIQLVLEMDVLSPLRNMLASGEAGCRKQAAKAIGNLCYYGTAAQHDQLMSSGVLVPYCALLAAPDGTLAALVVAGLHALVLAAEKDDTDSEINDCKLKHLCLELDDICVINDQSLIQQFQSQVIDECLRRQAQELESNISFHARFKDIIFEDGKVFTLTDIIEELKSQDLATQTRAARAARRMTSRARGVGETRLRSISDFLVENGILKPLIAALDKDDCNELQHEAVCALAIITCVKGHINAVNKGGAISILIALLAKEGEVAFQAVTTLGNMADDYQTKIAILEQHAVLAMVPHLHPETPPRQLTNCMMTLRRLCSNNFWWNSTLVELVSSAMPCISEMLSVADHRVIIQACGTIEDLCNKWRNPLILCSKSVHKVPGLVERLVALLGHAATQVQEAALKAVLNVIRAGQTEMSCCFNAGCLDHFVRLLQCSEPSLVEHTLLIITEMFSWPQHTYIKQALEKDILALLLNILANGELKCQVHAARAVENLSRKGSSEQRARIISSGVYERCCVILAARDKMGTTKALRELYDQPCVRSGKSRNAGWHLAPDTCTISELGKKACWIIRNAMKSSEETRAALEAVPGLTACLVSLMGHSEAQVQEAALDAVRNMLCGTDTQIDLCLNAGCLDHIVSLLQSRKRSIIKLAAEATCIIFITHLHVPNIERVLKAILTVLRNILADVDLECQSAAVNAISVLCCHGSAAQRDQLVSSDVFTSYCATLAAADSVVAKCGWQVLEGLDSLLEAARDGDMNATVLHSKLTELSVRDQIQRLTEHEEKEVRESAEHILSTYLL